jgi:hypothetical protein
MITLSPQRSLPGFSPTLRLAFMSNTGRNRNSASGGRSRDAAQCGGDFPGLHASPFLPVEEKQSGILENI